MAILLESNAAFHGQHTAGNRAGKLFFKLPQTMTKGAACVKVLIIAAIWYGTSDYGLFLNEAIGSKSFFEMASISAPMKRTLWILLMMCWHETEAPD